jgi:hypothetical protein
MEPAGQRPITDLVESLRRHVRLLREYERRAFHDGNDDYLGEIAAKLRLLSIAKGQNVPLLIRLMKVCKVKARIKPKGSRPANWGAHDSVTLSQILGQSAMKVKTSVGNVMLTRRELIEVVAEKHGGAHEDWQHPEWLTITRDPSVQIKGRSPLAVPLRVTTRAVLLLADHLLKQLTPQVIDAAERRRKGNA